MSQETIYLKDVLKQMATLDSKGKAPVFSIAVRTYNQFSKTGGRMLRLEKAKMLMAEENPHANTVQALRTKPKKRSKIKKDPQHWKNYTRNIRDMSNPHAHPIKIKIRYIIEFNNKKVIY